MECMQERDAAGGAKRGSSRDVYAVSACAVQAASLTAPRFIASDLLHNVVVHAMH